MTGHVVTDGHVDHLCLAMRHFPGSHTAEAIYALTQSTLDQLRVRDSPQLVAIVTDNGYSHLLLTNLASNIAKSTRLAKKLRI